MYVYIYNTHKPKLNLETILGNPALPEKHSRGSTKFHNQNLKQIGEGVYELWSDLKKQTNRDYYFEILNIKLVFND